MGACETLIVFENLEISRIKVRNNQTNAEKVLHLRPEQEGDRSFFTDPITGQDLEVIEKGTLLEWLAESYKEFGANLEFVTNRSQEGAQFVKGFGGIGGILRYRVDFQSHAVHDDNELLDDDLDDYI